MKIICWGKFGLILLYIRKDRVSHYELLKGRFWLLLTPPGHPKTNSHIFLYIIKKSKNKLVRHVQLWWELSEDYEDKCSQVQMAAQRNKLFSLCWNIFFSGKDFWCRVKIIGEDYSGEYEKVRKFWITMEWLHRGVRLHISGESNNLKLRRSRELRYRMCHLQT